ncbi:MAG: HlyD family efflux transporter periplasmic adaptor subunit [Kiritimatiellae bacterium]|nr:HlyD family efflux transporter periplasmic adaptor subunit [Kiritimatiellia bacterium]
MKVKWPFLVWLVALVLAFFFFFFGGRFGTMIGVVDTVSDDYAPLEESRLMAIEVAAGQDVTEGQVLCRFDTALLDAEIAVQRALYVEARDSMDDYHEAILELNMEHGVAVTDAENQLLLETANQSRDQAEYEYLKGQVGKLQQDVDQNTVPFDVALVVARYKALSEGLKRYPALIDAHRNARDQAKARQALFHEWLSARSETEPQTRTALQRKTELHLEAISNQLALLELRREQYTVRARRPGRVSQILKDPGDVVVPAEPVVRVIETNALEIRGFIPESNAHDVMPGSTAYINRRSGRGQVLEATVTVIEPEVLGLPTRVSPIPGQVMRGRRLHLRLKEPTNEFLPGETVQIRLVVPLFSRFFGGSDSDKPTRTENQPGS